MRNLLSLKGSFSLGFPPTAALKQNITDKNGLKWDDRRDGQDRPAILLPHGRLTKVHDALVRQPSLADAPPLQFPAVIRRRSEPYGWRIEGAWLVSLEYSQGHVRSLLAQ